MPALGSLFFALLLQTCFHIKCQIKCFDRFVQRCCSYNPVHLCTGPTPFLLLTGLSRPSLISTSSGSRCSRAPTTELTMRQRAAEGRSKRHQRDILLWRSDRDDKRLMMTGAFEVEPKVIFFRFRWNFRWTDISEVVLMVWKQSHMSCPRAVGLLAVWFLSSLCVSLHSCVDTQRGSRSRCRFSLEQLTTAPSGHIHSIRYTGTIAIMFLSLIFRHLFMWKVTKKHLDGFLNEVQPSFRLCPIWMLGHNLSSDALTFPAENVLHWFFLCSLLILW